MPLLKPKNEEKMFSRDNKDSKKGQAPLLGASRFFDASYEPTHIDTVLEVHELAQAQKDEDSRFVPTLFNRTVKDAYTIKEVYELIWEKTNENEFISYERKKL